MIQQTTENLKVKNGKISKGRDDKISEYEGADSVSYYLRASISVIFFQRNVMNYHIDEESKLIQE